MKNNSLWLVIIASSMAVLLMADNVDAEDVKKYYRAVVVRKNETAVLPCWELSDPTALLFWMSPEDVLIRSGDQHSSKYRVNPMDGSLTVYESVKIDEGIYKCAFSITPSSESNYKMIESELQVIDTSYIPELDDWETNLMRGLIAAASTAVFFIAACGVKHFSWHERHVKGKLSQPSLSSDDDPSSTSSSARTNSLTDNQKNIIGGIDNQAMESETRM